MAEGVAQAIVVGSVVLTVLSLGLVIRTARTQARIRPGFDVLRAVVGVGAIVLMAAVVGVSTPLAWVGAAIMVGGALGFAQGANLRVVAGEGGLFARRSPLSLVLWGAGIVVMQGAGIASRTGAVRFGQTLGWFSVCLGIGLMLGRRGPMLEAGRIPSRAGAVAVMMLLLAVIPALAQEPAEEPLPWTYQGEGTARTELRGKVNQLEYTNTFEVTITLLADGTVEYQTRIPAPYSSVKAFCVTGDLGPPGRMELDERTEDAVSPVFFGTHGAGEVRVNITETRVVEGTYTGARLEYHSYSETTSEACIDTGLDGGMRTVIVESRVDIPRISPPASLPTQPADTASTTTSSPTTTPAGVTPPVSVPPTTVPADAKQPGTSPPVALPDDPADPLAVDDAGDDEIEPKEAAAQAAVGVAATVVIGVISVIESGGGIGTIFGGGGPDGGPRRPSDLPPGKPGSTVDPSDPRLRPAFDENGDPLEVNDGRHPEVPVGHVLAWDGDGWRWMPREESDRLTREAIEARQRGEAMDTEIREGMADQDADSQESARRRRAAEEQAARERAAARQEHEERVEDYARRRDQLESELTQAQQDAALDARQSWERMREDYWDGVYGDANQLDDVVVDATRVVVQEAFNPANWEAVRDTVVDVATLPVGGHGWDNMQESVSEASRLAQGLGTAFANDPLGTIKAMSPIQDFEDAMDPNRTLGERLGSMGAGLVDTFGTLAGGGGLAGGLGNVSDAARLAERATDAAGAVRDVERMTDAAAAARDVERVGTGSAGAGRDVERVTDARGDAVRTGEVTEDAAAASRRTEPVGEPPGPGSSDPGIPVEQRTPGDYRDHYDDPISPRHVDPQDPRHVPPGTPADERIVQPTSPYDWENPPPQLVPEEGLPPRTPDVVPEGIDAADMDLPSHDVSGSPDPLAGDVHPGWIVEEHGVPEFDAPAAPPPDTPPRLAPDGPPPPTPDVEPDLGPMDLENLPEQPDWVEDIVMDPAGTGPDAPPTSAPSDPDLDDLPPPS